ncbi:hypothetical protein VCHC39A1_1159, partial [Vibrio cholerae HC-39A1]
MPTPITLYNR